MILALYPCYRGFAFALIKSKHEVVDIGRVSFSQQGIEHMMKRVKHYLSFHTPDTIALERYDTKKSTPRGELLQNAIEHFAKQKGITTKRYDYEQVKTAFSSYGATTRYDMACVLAKTFPQFAFRLPQKRTIWKGEEYTIPMFNALALGMTHIYMNE